MSTATDNKEWGRAAWLSGALLVVPLAGMVALFALTGDDDDGDEPRPVADEPLVAPPPKPEPVRPSRPAPEPPPVAVAPKPAAVTDEGVEPEVVDDAEDSAPVEPSVLDPCCEALLKMMDDDDAPTISAAYRTCTNGRRFDDPNVAYKAMGRILERRGYEVPSECRPR